MVLPCKVLRPLNNVSGHNIALVRLLAAVVRDGDWGLMLVSIGVALQQLLSHRNAHHSELIEHLKGLLLLRELILELLHLMGLEIHQRVDLLVT